MIQSMRNGWIAAQRLALQLPPTRAAQDGFKNRTISRAEGGQLQARVRARIDGYSFVYCYALLYEWQSTTMAKCLG